MRDCAVQTSALSRSREYRECTGEAVVAVPYSAPHPCPYGAIGFRGMTGLRGAGAVGCGRGGILCAEDLCFTDAGPGSVTCNLHSMSSFSTVSPCFVASLRRNTLSVLLT